MTEYMTNDSLLNSTSSDSSGDDDSSDDSMGDLLMVRYLMANKRYFIDKIPCRTSMLSGKEYILEVLVGNPTRCYEGFRMKPHVFKNLCNRLKMMNLLHDAKDVSVEEGVAMGLSILCHGTRALATLGVDLIKPMNRGDIQPEIESNPKWFSYFQKCIGAIDGSHIAAWAPASKQKTFRGRKATLVTQNIMAVCSHDMMFTFVYAGWEGTANDSRVFIDALTRQTNGFPFPTNDNYYVVDAGYPNIPGFLAPYRGEKYHLNDFRGHGRIRKKYELFNYRHSSLRNIIERAFGVLKARFPILKSIPSYPLRRQKLIPIACCTLHNFIRKEDRADKLFTLYGREGLEVYEEDNLRVVQEGVHIDMSQQSQMSAIRDNIADQLWNDYNNHRR
ncbi:protein ALP1-like [Mercurialis annua]|uniref:protein ALP1-like n=1 Tax=Mercurialis annua TaxID=3986 RepID=UPI0024ACC79D|nr:protein ALP1-like [Mercurialis annua]